MPDDQHLIAYDQMQAWHLQCPSLPPGANVSSKKNKETSDIITGKSNNKKSGKYFILNLNLIIILWLDTLVN